MKKIEFTITIAADKEKVWNTMLQPDSYKQWVNAGWPGAYYVGKWEKGQNIRFLSSGGAGTMAMLDEYQPYDHILARHVAVVNPDGTEDRESKLATGWIGSTESYSFNEKNGKTEVKIQINTHPEWEEMFKEGWPGALQQLKQLSEK